MNRPCPRNLTSSPGTQKAGGHSSLPCQFLSHAHPLKDDIKGPFRKRAGGVLEAQYGLCCHHWELQERKHATPWLKTRRLRSSWLISTLSYFLVLYPWVCYSGLTSLQLGPLLCLVPSPWVGCKCLALNLSVAFVQPLSISAVTSHSMCSREATCLKARAGGQDTRVLASNPHPDLEKVKVPHLVSHVYDIGD